MFHPHRPANGFPNVDEMAELIISTSSSWVLLNFLSKPCRQAWSQTFGGRRQWSPSGNWCRWVLDFRVLREKSWEFRHQWIHYGLQHLQKFWWFLRLPLSDATNFAAVQWMEKGLETPDEGSFFNQYCAARRQKKAMQSAGIEKWTIGHWSSKFNWEFSGESTWTRYSWWG